MTLGAFLKKYRATHSLSLRDLAKQIGISSGYLNMLEKGRNPQTGKPISPSIAIYEKIASLLQITPETFLKLLNDQTVSDVPAPPPARRPMPIENKLILTAEEEDYIYKLRSLSPEHRAYIGGQIDAFSNVDKAAMQIEKKAM